MLHHWNDPYEIVEVVNVMNYKMYDKGVVNTYPANMLKQYVERRNVLSYHYAVIDARFNVKSEDQRHPAFDKVTVDTVTSSDVTCGDIAHSDVTSDQVSPLQGTVSV